MSDVTIRRATPDDAPALHELGQRVTLATYASISADYATWTLETWWSTDGMRESMATTPHRAAGFYRAHGFVETGVTVGGRFPDQVWMALDLRG